MNLSSPLTVLYNRETRVDPHVPATNRHADCPFLIGRRSNVGLWLAHEDLAMHCTRSNAVGF